ncbi:ZN862 protein, partial [Acromyrmex insinuator]
MNSTHHKNNIEKNLLLSSDDNLSKKNRKLSLFHEKWLEIEELKYWLRKEPRDATKFFCLICNKSFLYTKKRIYSHAISKLHSSIEISKSNEDFKSFVTFEKYRKEAEIRYAALLTDHNISYRHSHKILNLFQYAGEGLNVSKTLHMDRTKCTEIITNILCPIETKHLVNKIQNTKFTVFIDFTSDIYKDNIWMSFQVRYVDSVTLDVRLQLVELMCIDVKDFSADKLFERLRNKILELNIPFSNIVALLCNNASVMTENHSLFKKEFKKLCPHLMMFLCSCHSVALVTHNACDKIPTFCEKFRKDIFTYINDRPKHLSTFKEFCKCFQRTNHKILKYDIHWISRYTYVEKFWEYWDIIKNFLETVRTQFANNLLFTMCMVELNFFNTFFQTLEMQIYLLQSQSLILQQICQNFLKSEQDRKSFNPF